MDRSRISCLLLADSHTVIYVLFVVCSVCVEQVPVGAVGGKVEQKRIQPDKEVTLQDKSNVFVR